MGEEARPGRPFGEEVARGEEASHPLGCRSIFSILFEEGRSIRLRQLLFRFAAALHFLGSWNLGPHHDW